MTAPGTKFIWDDQSFIPPLTAPAEDTIDRPVYMTVFSSDKGPEKFQKNLTGQNFLKLYDAKPNFYKHGQPLLQAFAIAQAGGRQFAKRIVANDSKLANLTLVATVTAKEIQKTDENGNPLYIDAVTGEYTTDPNDGANAPANREVANIKYELKGVDWEYTSATAGTNDIDVVFDQILTKVNAEYGSATHEGVFPLFTLTDTGRGKSNKKVQFNLDTATRRPIRYAKYQINTIEDDSTQETLYFTLDPYITEYASANDTEQTNMGMETVISLSSYELQCKFHEAEWGKFVTKVATISGLSEDIIEHADILFGTDVYGDPLGSNYNDDAQNIDRSPAVVIDEESVNLSNPAGINLVNGSNPNGSFGDYPIESAEYNSKVLEVFKGQAAEGDEIYDLDNTPIYVIFDANYDDVIKEAICELVDFREDCFFFRDIGLHQNNLLSIKEKAQFYKKSRFAATYVNSYNVIDPYYRKQIEVTVMYNLVSKFVDHFINGANRPFAGQAYGITFENDIVPGTLNFKPKRVPKTPSNAKTYDQKQFFDDLRLNYIAYYDNIPTMDTEYTSQSAYTQLSWINNVILVQNIIREIRKMCPKNRYTFLDGQDLVNYKKDVNDIIKNYSSLFKSITVSYIEDTNYQHNKIFYAALVVVFRDFVQSEVFKITAVID